MLEDKVIIVTGAGNGIGAAAAECFADYGAHVLVTDIVGEDAERVAEKIRGKGQQAHAMAVDVVQEEQVAEMVDTAVRRFGRLDGAFNNAGIGGPVVPTAQQELESWRRLLDINVIGSWFCLKYEIEAMLKTGGGSIVANASVAGLLGVRDRAPYAASKAALINMIRCAAIEYGDFNIRVNTVCPGASDSPGLRRNVEKLGIDVMTLMGRRPINRPGDARETAEAAAWLLSSKSSYVTGADLAVDGGHSAAFTN